MPSRKSRRKKPTQGEIAGIRAEQRENFETLAFQTQPLPGVIEGPGGGGSGPDMSALGELASAIRELVSRFAVGSPGSGGAGGRDGVPAGSLGGGGGGAPPTSDAGGGSPAAKRFLAGQGGERFGGSIGGAGIGFVGTALNKFGGEVGRSIGSSGLEVSASQAAREHGLDPGRFTESALGALGDSGIPLVSGIAKIGEGFARKANADVDAKSGRTALIQARARLADIAGGLAQRGAHFTNEQLLQARDVLQERAQRELNVRMQIRSLEDGIGAQRAGLGGGGHAR